MQVINFKPLLPIWQTTSQISLNSENVPRVYPISAKLKPEILAVTLKPVENRLLSQLQLFLLTVSSCLDFCSTLTSTEQRYWCTQLGFSKAHSGAEWLHWILVAVNCQTSSDYGNNTSWYADTPNYYSKPNIDFLSSHMHRPSEAHDYTQTALKEGCAEEPGRSPPCKQTRRTLACGVRERAASLRSGLALRTDWNPQQKKRWRQM